MPLDVARLRDSDFVSLESAEDFRAGVLLWCASWHQIPAGSLPDDDRILSQLSGYGFVVKEWQNHRAGALRGWTKCADGRLYHAVIAEKVNESWYKKVRYAWEKECERIRKQNKKLMEQGKEPLPYPPEPVINSTTLPPENTKIPPERKGDSAGKPENGSGIPPEKALKGEGEGQGEGQGQGEVNLKEQNQHLNGPEKTEDVPQRNVQIAVLLRAKGIKPFTFAHPQALEWAEDPRITDEILTAAVTQARDYKTTGDISPNYLKPIIEQLINPPEPRQQKPREDWTWKKSKAGIEAKGREMGMFARGTESHDDFAVRIQTEIDKRKGAQQ